MKNLIHFAYSLKRTLVILMVLALAMINVTAFAQAININITIAPPYSPYYSDYSGPNAGKVLLIITNTTATQQKIKLTGQLQGDNGIKITTKSNYVPLSPIILNPRESKQLNGFALKDIFDLNSLNVYGIDKSRLIYTSRLPEGNYSFCIQAVDMNTNQVVSATAPLGCTNITISYPDAPVLIGPMDGQGVTATYPQSATFNWINAGFVVPGAQYILQIAEMPFTSNNPNQVLNATSFPLVNKTVMGTSTNLSPSDPPLKLGKRYAWRVKIVDPTGKTVFKNDGISRANQFRYGTKSIIPSVVTLITPKANVKIKTEQELKNLKFAWTFKDNTSLNDPITLPGELQSLPDNAAVNTRFAFYIKRVKTDAEIQAEKKASIMRVNGNSSANTDNGIIVGADNAYVTLKDNPTVSAYLKDGNIYQYYVKHVASGAVSETSKLYVEFPKAEPPYTISLAGTIKYNFFKNYNAKTLQGFSFGAKSFKVLRVKMLLPVTMSVADVKVVENGVTKIYKDTVTKIDVLNNISTISPSQVNISDATLVASGKTDANGSFKVDAQIYPSLYEINTLQQTGKGASAKYTALVNVLVVHVDDPRFSDPNWVIHPHKDQLAVALPNELVQAYDYDINVKMSAKHQRDYKGKLYLLRKEVRTVLGEGDNVMGQSLEVPMIDIGVGQNDNPGIEYNKATTKYKVVSVKDISVSKDLLNGFNFDFNNALISSSLSDDYVVHFKPDESLDALYFQPIAVKSVSSKKLIYTSTLFAKTVTKEKVEFGPKFLTMRISGIYKYKWNNPGNAAGTVKALPKGTKLLLCKGTLTSDFFKEGTELDGKLVLATAVVGDGGSYSFDLGLMDYEDFNKDASKSMVILIESPYYYADPRVITYNHKEEVQMPNLVAHVKQYILQSSIYVKASKKPIEGMTVYLLRQKSNVPLQSLPPDEGDPNRNNYVKKEWSEGGNKYEILDRTTSLSGGKFTFSRLVCSSENNSDGYLIAAEPMTGSYDNYLTEPVYPITGSLKLTTLIGTFFFTTDFTGQKYKEFNDQQEIKTVVYDSPDEDQFVPVLPQLPYIEGGVYPYSNTSTQPLGGVLVELFNMKDVPSSASSTQAQIAKLNGRQAEDSQITKSNGRFYFNAFNYGPGSGWYMIRLTKNGFMPTYRNVNFGAELLKGKRADMSKVFMELPKTVYAKVVGPNGEPVPARIIVGNDFSWTDSKSILLTHNVITSESKFYEKATMMVPKGSVNFTVIPLDKANYKTTIAQRNITDNSSDLGSFIVSAQEHHINVRCINAETNSSVSAQVFVTNIDKSVKVNKQDVSIFGIKLTSLSFKSPGSQFDLKVVPDGDYTVAKTQVTSDMTEDVYIDVYVYPAVSITFSAYEFNRQQKVSIGSFDAFLDDFAPDEYVKRVFSTTIEFSKLPRGKFVTGGIVKKGYAGTTKSQTLNTSKNWDLKLTPLENGFPEKIYGFTVRYSKVQKEKDGYSIAGQLYPSGNEAMSQIKIDPDKKPWLNFKNVMVTLKDLGHLGKAIYPKAQLVFEENEMDAVAYNTYRAKVLTKSGLSLYPEGTGASIVGYVGIDLTALAPGINSDSQYNTGEKTFLFLNTKSRAYIINSVGNQAIKAELLNTMTTNGMSQFGPEMKVSTYSMKRPSFTGPDDVSVDTQGDVMMTADGIKFSGQLTTNLAHAKTKNIAAAAKFMINKSGFSSLEEAPFTIDLNLWKMQVSKWKFNENGLMVNKGILNALGLTIPFKNLSITHDKIGYGDFDVKSLKILNAFPITFNADDIMTSFGYDSGFSKNGGAWSVSILSKSTVSSLGSLKGLPDVGANDAIQIQNISLYDSGSNDDTRIILKDGQPPVTLNGIAKFSPGAVWGGSDFMTFRGKLDLSVPNLNGLDLVTYDLKYQNNNGQLKHVKSDPFKNLNLDVNGIKVNFASDTTSQEFTNGKLILRGVLEDKVTAPYRIDVILEKSLSGTSVFVPKKPGQRIYLTANKDGSYLGDADGSMKLKFTGWDHFTFGGNLTNSTGITPGKSRMDFTIKGDIVADKQKVGVQNMDAQGAGISGINFTYDFVTGQINGSAHIEQYTPKFTLIGDIQLQVGSKEWYVFANAIAKDIQDSPINQAGATFMVGDAPITAEQLDAMHKHFLDGFIPLNFDNNMKAVKGVLMVYSAEMPVPLLPSWDIDLSPVLQTTFKHGIVMNMYSKFDFSTDPKQISAFMGSRIGAYVKVSAAASIGLACAGVGLQATAFADINLKIPPLDPKGFNGALALTFDLQGHAYVGAGICDSNCETPCVDLGFLGEVCSPIPCFKHSVKGGLTMVLGGTVDKNGIHLANPLKTTGSYQ